MKTKLILLITLLSLWIVPAQGQGAASDLLGRINTLRSGLGLHTYTTHPALVTAAQQHANWMVDTGEVTHIQANGSTPASRAAAAGFNSAWVSENIYMGGLATADSAWNFWTNSSVHYAGLTSENFTHIGIATAQGEWGQAYVLVFGTFGGQTNSAAYGGTGRQGNAASGNDENAAAPPPSFVIGTDEVGNIMHELQAGQTLGDVLLTYGYTWDDLPAVMELNELTDADIRALEVGQVILVPPQSGTYTPTAPAEETAVATESTPVETSADVTEEAEGVIPTPLEPSPTDRIDVPVDGIIPTPVPESTLENGLLMPATFVAPQDTPTLAPTITPDVPTATLTLAPSATSQQSVRVSTVAVATQIPTDAPVENVTVVQTSRTQRPPFWLIAAIVVQVGVLGFASVEYWRRNR